MLALDYLPLAKMLLLQDVRLQVGREYLDM
jgi:hypothetical protein